MSILVGMAQAKEERYGDLHDALILRIARAISHAKMGGQVR